MQELQILPYDQCFAAFGGFLDSDTKQNSGSTVRKYSITNAYSVSPCSTSTDIDCRSGWRFFLVWRIFTYTGERGKKGNRWWRGRGEERESPHWVLPSPPPHLFFPGSILVQLSRGWISVTSRTSKENTQKKNCQLRRLPLIWLSTVKVKEPILLIHPVRGGSCHIEVTAYWPSRLGVEIADFDLT